MWHPLRDCERPRQKCARVEDLKSKQTAKNTETEQAKYRYKMVIFSPSSSVKLELLDKEVGATGREYRKGS